MPNLGTVGASEQLITDLYIYLRRTINSWAAVTQQTAQARMGYVGQHLVSVATSFPGGRSGARGKDLVLPNGEHAEIKTCYRVDQLGSCKDCGAVVASIELSCSECQSDNVLRKDDSKWLIGIQHDQEFEAILDPLYYYLVLFDFVELYNPDKIRAAIYRVDSLAPGFAYCMIDYYLNIRAKSKSKAPFNLWPYQLKFYTMRPTLIYRSIINDDDSIDTEVFPGRDPEEVVEFPPLWEFSRSRNLTLEKIQSIANAVGHELKSRGKAKNLVELDGVLRPRFTSDEIADLVATALYMPDVECHIESLPARLRTKIGRA